MATKATNQGVFTVPLLRNCARILGLLAALVLFPLAGHADQGFPYAGIQVINCQKNFKALFNDLEAAVRKHRMGVVGRASASMGAAQRGIEIPGNAVFGVFRNDFAVRRDRSAVALLCHPK